MTDWEARYQAGETPWEKGEAAPPLIELLGKLEKPAWGRGPILVPGCGFGHDVRALSAALGLPVVGVDISPMAVERAREFPPAGGETYDLANFLDPAWRAGRKFSAVWEHTCFCAIDPGLRVSYAAAVAELLPEGGLLVGVFFLNPYDPGEEEAGPPFGTTVEELEKRFAPWFKLESGQVPSRAYPGREGREWTGVFRKLPQPWVAG